MRKAATVFLGAALLVSAGCAPVQTRPKPAQIASSAGEPHIFKPIEFKYDPSRPEATNFAAQLQIPIFQCELEAGNGNYAVKYGNQERLAIYSKALLDCNKHANSQADIAIARLKSAKLPPKQAELAKNLYAKWSAYLATVSTYSAPDQRAKANYQAARQALASEVKFAQ